MEISGISGEKRDSNYSFLHGEMADSFVCIKDSCRSYLLEDQEIIEFTCFV